MSTKRRASRIVTTLLAAGLAVTSLAAVPAGADTVVSGGEAVTSTGSLGNYAAPNGPVTRSQAVNRAKDWADNQVPYSPNGLSSPFGWWADDATGGRYREDCSGLISMAWQLDSSLTTDSLTNVATPINFSQLRPGDALNNKADGHVVLFAGWVDQSAGTFQYYAEHRRGVPTSLGTGNLSDPNNMVDGHPVRNYQALRYKRIIDATPSGIGVYRPSDRTFYVADSHGSPVGYNTYGNADDVPLVGHFAGPGRDTVGVYRPLTQEFILSSDNANRAVYSVFGNKDDVPLVGDWDGTGKQTIGVYRPSEGAFYLTTDNLTPKYRIPFGDPNWIPVVGNWSGTGKDTVGVYDPNYRIFHLSDSNTAVADNHTIPFGNPKDVPIKGDWDGTGTDKVGVYRPDTQEFFGAVNGTGRLLAKYGNPEDKPLTGHWS
ncbi:hypothetical protein [Kitasatospora sp. NPDC093102]|uniref:hypothetical protein n=1 Tax=Kitasatospora sp. NPDC093102 TaxID=3155069 RepID=UPI00341403DF